jgi:hypothetical protein
LSILGLVAVTVHGLGENAGLLTYQIPKEQMRMGVAFTELEKYKDELNVEDYSVAQPTLEQVICFSTITFAVTDTAVSMF